MHTAGKRIDAEVGSSCKDLQFKWSGNIKPEEESRLKSTKHCLRPVPAVKDAHYLTIGNPRDRFSLIVPASKCTVLHSLLFLVDHRTRATLPATPICARRIRLHPPSPLAGYRAPQYIELVSALYRRTSPRWSLSLPPHRLTSRLDSRRARRRAYRQL